jgi:hypothetical protein
MPADPYFIMRKTLLVLPLLISAGIAQTLPESPGAILYAQQATTSGETSSEAQKQAPNIEAEKLENEGKQPKRILGIIPNYRAVSADVELPPDNLYEKFKLATQDSFDYSSFIFAGIIAGVGDAQRSYPEFGHGAAAYGRYYWHSFADQAVGNYFTEAIVPAITREDPRYYTKFHGSVLNRTGYAISRLFITRTDDGGRTFNFSEIIGNGAGAGVSNLYYPSRERTWTKTGQKWVTQVGLDGVFNVFKEFWPDINKKFFHQKY